MSYDGLQRIAFRRFAAGAIDDKLRALRKLARSNVVGGKGLALRYECGSASAYPFFLNELRDILPLPWEMIEEDIIVLDEKSVASSVPVVRGLVLRPRTFARRLASLRDAFDTATEDGVRRAVAESMTARPPYDDSEEPVGRAIQAIVCLYRELRKASAQKKGLAVLWNVTP